LEEVNGENFHALRYKLMLEPSPETKDKCIQQLKNIASTDAEKRQAHAFETAETNPADAISTLEEVANETNDFDLLIHVITTRLLLNVGIDQVKKDCDKILSSGSASPILLSKTYFLKALTASDAIEQLRLFNMSIDEYPKCVIALWERAKLLHELQRHDDALTDIQRILKVNPLTAEAAFLAGSILYRQKRNIPAAKQQLLSSLNLAPTHVGMYELLVEIYAREDKDYDKCIQLLDNGISKGASKLELIYFKCSISMWFAKFDKALEYVHECQKILDSIKTVTTQQAQEKQDGNRNLSTTIRVIETLRDHLADFPEWHKIVQEHKPPYVSYVSVEQVKSVRIMQAKKSKPSTDEDEKFAQMIICFAYITCPILLRSFPAKIVAFLEMLKDPNYNFIRYACNNPFVADLILSDFALEGNGSMIVQEGALMNQRMHQRLNDSKTDDDFFTKLCKMKSVKEL
jgi:tetratricopeptide (TPR) repeat protein